MALNNIACYYISIEGDVGRGFENLKVAYEDMPSNLDEESKKIITENYNKAEKLYEDYINEKVNELSVLEFKFIY